MKCKTCNIEFELILDTCSTDYKKTICMNPTCELYKKQQFTKIEKGQKE